eukprot:1145802-Pelagomonas_calceolata.AAC.3
MRRRHCLTARASLCLCSQSPFQTGCWGWGRPDLAMLAGADTAAHTAGRPPERINRQENKGDLAQGGT